MNYDARNWRLLTNQLMSSRNEIDSTNRAQIVDDSLNLARAGELSYDVALNVSAYLIGEQVCCGLRREFEELRGVFAGLSTVGFRAALIRLHRPHAAHNRTLWIV